MWFKATRFMETCVVMCLGFVTAMFTFAPPNKNHPFIERDPAYSLPVKTAGALSPAWAYAIILTVPTVACIVVEATRTAVASRLQRKKALREETYYGDNTPATKACRCDTFLAVVAVSRRLLMVFLSSSAITLGLRKLIARPAPNFFASCDYAGYGTLLLEGGNGATPASLNAALAPYFASTVPGHFGDVAKCAQCAVSGMCADALLSSPSSRAGVAYSGMLFTMLTVDRVFRRAKAAVAERDRTFYYRADSTLTLRFFMGAIISNSIRFTCAVVLFALASFVAAHEYMDNMHHVADVVSGALIGAVCTIVVWGIFEEDATANVASVNISADFAARQAHALLEHRAASPPRTSGRGSGSARLLAARFPNLAKSLQ